MPLQAHWRQRSECLFTAVQLPKALARRMRQSRSVIQEAAGATCRLHRATYGEAQHATDDEAAAGGSDITTASCSVKGMSRR